MRPLKSLFSKIAMVLVCLLAIAFIARGPGTTPPPFTFMDAGHGRHSLAEFKGEYVLLNLWASWCGPCLMEMPSLNKLSKDYEGRLKVVTISTDTDAEQTVAFLKRHHMDNLTPYIDDKNEVVEAIRLRGLPTSVLIGPDGNIISKTSGALDWNDPDIRKQLDEFLNVPPTKKTL